MQSRARNAVIGASVGVVLVALVWYIRVHVGIVARADRSILLGFAGLDRPGVNRIASFFANLCDPKPYVFLAAIPILVALARRRPRVATMIGVVILGANATTQQLKPLLAESQSGGLIPGLGAASFPSGHATAAMTLALCSVIAVPARWRPRVAASMAAFAVVVCYSFLELRWHYPSDVLGGFLVAGIWTLLGAAALSIVDARWPQRAIAPETRRTAPVPIAAALTPVAIVLLAALASAALLAIARPHAVVTYARAHEAFIFGAAAIGAMSLIMATAAMLAFRRDRPEA